MKLLCPFCNKPHDFDGTQYLELSVELSWFTDGGSSGDPDRSTVEGICQPCGERIYRGLKTVLLSELVEEEVEFEFET